MRTLLWIAWLGAAGADVQSTHAAIARGAHEANPALQMSAPVRDSMVLGTSGAMACALTCTGFYKQHPRIAWTLTAVAGGLHTYATVHNLQQGRGR